ncbi:hypothetical protein PCASD_04636 [Puccinia coronata f. sp. avenae]|uniref:Uncharacterized protein n=1 Tax=Puccinia coronata f. sp. avenae TaxID=200324 RepID=A0A2N5UXJ8_9BASI|nr:hypothetical protein PCASD_04636 [Puccinia coronata f. sp. avenae]
MNSLSSLLLQGTSSDSCQNGNNPLSKLTSTLDQQTHADQHRFQPARTHQQQTTSRRTNDLLLQQQLNQEQQHQLTDKLSSIQLENHPAHWSSAFLRSIPIQSVLHSSEQSSSSNHPQWHSEFTQSRHPSKLDHQQPPLPTHSNIIPSASLIGPSAFSQLRPITAHHQSYHPIHPINQRPLIQGSNLSTTADWDSAFLKYDHHAPNATLANLVQAREEQVQKDQEASYVARSHSPISSTSPDELAKTAASLIATVEQGKQAQNHHETHLTSAQTEHENSTADKFNQSSFMEFMRQLRDGEVRVEGDKVVQQVAQARDSSSTVNTSTQMNESINHLQQQPHTGLPTSNYTQNLPSFGISGDPTPKQEEHATQSHDQPSVSKPPSSDQLVTAFREDLESRMKEMNTLMEETYAELERAQYQAMMNRFQGDGGGLSDLDDILNAASEVGRPEKQTWTNTATHVPGATESWTEEFDQVPQNTSLDTSARVNQDLDMDPMGMFGRPIHPREFELEHLKRLQRVPSAQQQEWEMLQTQWETVDDMEKLQSEWETAGNTVADSAQDHSTTSIPHVISPAMFLERIETLKAETGYNFQQANPQIFLQQERASGSSRHHSSHQPWQESSTLDRSGVSPLESVLQKEKEVLSQPESATAWYELGVKQQENEREEMAIQALQQAIKLDPELTDAILALAISYSNENRRAEAFEEIERWIRVETSRVPKYRQAALRHSSVEANNVIGVSEKAAAEESQKLGAKHGELTGRLIELARLGGRVDGTASVDPDVQIALGVLFNSNDEFEKACDCFSTALAVRPDDPLLFNRLGATLANSGKPEQAIDYYNRAIELLPSYIRARYNLSISLINLGKYFESIKTLLDSLIIQQHASSALSAPRQHADPQGSRDHDLAGVEQQSSGVTSDVLWQTLEINCSLVKNHFVSSQAALDDCFLTKDLAKLTELLADFL